MKKTSLLSLTLFSLLSITHIHAQEAIVVPENNTTQLPVTVSKEVAPSTLVKKVENNITQTINTANVEVNTSEQITEVIPNTLIKEVENNTTQTIITANVEVNTSEQIIQSTKSNTTKISIVEDNVSKVITPIIEADTNATIVIETVKVRKPVEVLKTKETIKKVSQPILIEVVAPPIVPTNDIIITLPSVPPVPVVTTKVPKLIILDSTGKMIKKDSMDNYSSKQEVIFSDHVAPPRFNVDRGHRKVEVAQILAGDIDNGRVSAYLHTALMSVDEAKEKLTAAGFTILSTFKVDKQGTATSIVFTNDAMKKAASKATRGFASALRINIDTKNKLTVISNPVYLMKAFMQDEYNQEVAQTTLKQLRDSFTGTTNSAEMIKFRILDRFQFMENMPFYQDMQTVSEGTNESLLAKVKASKSMVFEQVLDNGSILVGVHLGKRTRKFVKKIGYKNAGLLPYPVLIEKGKAYMLAPQYYIAIMYPQLKMSEFMKIATVPGAISKDIDRIFR